MKNSLLKARSRTVNFRVTQEEYEALRNACIAHGARCISDFAREATLRRAAERCETSTDQNSSNALLKHIAAFLSSLTDGPSIPNPAGEQSPGPAEPPQPGGNKTKEILSSD